MKVDEVMHKKIITVASNDTIAKALTAMEEYHVNGTPVVDQDGSLEGMIVKADIYRFLIAPGHYESCPVDWVMTKKVVVAYTKEDIRVVAKRLRENSIVALPVVEEDNKVVGIVTMEGLVDYLIEKL